MRLVGEQALAGRRILVSAAAAVTALALAIVALPASAQPPPRRSDGAATLRHVALAVAPTQFDPLPLLEFLDNEELHPDRVIVQALDCGQAGFLGDGLLFAPAPALADANRLGDLGEWCVARDVECWAALDLLRWWTEADPAQADPFAAHPALLATDDRGVALRQPDGTFASPFNPNVREALLAAVRELGRNYPDLRGLVVTCRLSVHSRMLGLDESSRAAYIRHRQIDPLDLPICCQSPDDDPEVRAYFHWRLNTVCGLVGAVATEFRRVVPHGKVAVVGQGNYYDLPAKLQATTCMDWLSWVAAGHADEVILEPDWRGLAYWDKAKNLMAKCRHPVPLTSLITSRPAYQNYSLMTAWNGYDEGHRAVDRIVVDPYYPEHVEDAQAILRRATQWRGSPP